MSIKRISPSEVKFQQANDASKTSSESDNGKIPSGQNPKPATCWSDWLVGQFRQLVLTYADTIPSNLEARVVPISSSETPAFVRAELASLDNEEAKSGGFFQIKKRLHSGVEDKKEVWNAACDTIIAVLKASHDKEQRKKLVKDYCKIEKQLCESGEISQEDKISIKNVLFKKSCERDNSYELLEVLFNSEEVSAKSRCFALATLVYKRNPENLKLLVSLLRVALWHLNSIEEFNLLGALPNKTGPNIVFLSDIANIFMDVYKNKDEPWYQAVLKGFIESGKFTLDGQRMSEDLRSEVFASACIGGCDELVKCFIEGGCLSDDDIKKGLISANLFNKVDVIRVLLESKKITPSDIQSLFINAFVSAEDIKIDGMKIMLQSLFQRKDVTSETIANIFLTVCNGVMREKNEPWLELEELFYDNGKITRYGQGMSPEFRLVVFKKAYESNLYQIVERFCSGGEISYQDKINALNHAYQFNCAILVKILVKQKELRLVDIEQFFDDACNEINFSMINAICSRGKYFKDRMPEILKAGYKQFLNAQRPEAA